MVDYSKLSELELIGHIANLSKTLKKYKQDIKKSSEARMNAGIDVSRAKMTTLNANLQRDAEVFERIKSELVKAVSFI